MATSRNVVTKLKTKEPLNRSGDFFKGSLVRMRQVSFARKYYQYSKFLSILLHFAFLRYYSYMPDTAEIQPQDTPQTEVTPQDEMKAVAGIWETYENLDSSRKIELVGKTLRSFWEESGVPHALSYEHENLKEIPGPMAYNLETEEGMETGTTFYTKIIETEPNEPKQIMVVMAIRAEVTGGMDPGNNLIVTSLLPYNDKTYQPDFNAPEALVTVMSENDHNTLRNQFGVRKQRPLISGEGFIGRKVGDAQEAIAGEDRALEQIGRIRNHQKYVKKSEKALNKTYGKIGKVNDEISDLTDELTTVEVGIRKINKESYTPTQHNRLQDHQPENEPEDDEQREAAEKRKEALDTLREEKGRKERQLESLESKKRTLQAKRQREEKELEQDRMYLDTAVAESTKIADKHGIRYDPKKPLSELALRKAHVKEYQRLRKLSLTNRYHLGEISLEKYSTEFERLHGKKLSKYDKERDEETKKRSLTKHEKAKADFDLTFESKHLKTLKQRAEQRKQGRDVEVIEVIEQAEPEIQEAVQRAQETKEKFRLKNLAAAELKKILLGNSDNPGIYRDDMEMWGYITVPEAINKIIVDIGAENSLSPGQLNSLRKMLSKMARGQMREELRTRNEKFQKQNPKESKGGESARWKAWLQKAGKLHEIKGEKENV